MLSIEAISAFSDNYIWLLHDAGKAYVVDPGDAAPVIQALKAKQLELEGILITHWHPDHIGGLEQLQDYCQFRLKIFGPESQHIPRINHHVYEGSQITLLGHDFTIWETPGHTLDHITYISTEQSLIFCGDTLFAAGCGRVFEGTAQMMHETLQRFLTLDDDMGIYCAHEYTLSNLKFAQAADPNNLAISDRLEQVKAIRARNEITLPSTIRLERLTNPFLRTNHAGIARAPTVMATQCDAAWSKFAELRAWKDNF